MVFAIRPFFFKIHSTRTCPRHFEKIRGKRVIFIPFLPFPNTATNRKSYRAAKRLNPRPFC